MDESSGLAECCLHTAEEHTPQRQEEGQSPLVSTSASGLELPQHSIRRPHRGIKPASVTCSHIHGCAKGQHRSHRGQTAQPASSLQSRTQHGLNHLLHSFTFYTYLRSVNKCKKWQKMTQSYEHKSERMVSLGRCALLCQPPDTQHREFCQEQHVVTEPLATIRIHLASHTGPVLWTARHSQRWGRKAKEP